MMDHEPRSQKETNDRLFPSILRLGNSACFLVKRREAVGRGESASLLVILDFVIDFPKGFFGIMILRIKHLSTSYLLTLAFQLLRVVSTFAIRDSTIDATVQHDRRGR